MPGSPRTSAHRRFQLAVGDVPNAKRAPIDRLRELCLALPEVTERPSHGEPTWFIRGKATFVTFADHHHDDRLAFWCAAPPGAQAALVGSDPERFFVPPYVGHRGMCQPEEIAGAIAYLASDEARFVHGSILSIDGGVAAS